jgi:hypothetical protein
MSNTRLTLAQVKDTQEYSLLTGKQQLFVETYVQSGIDTGTYDPITSTLTAYRCKSRENARVMSYALMSNLRIIATLNRHFNREPIEDFVIQIDRAIQNKKLSIAQMQALKLKADVLGYGCRLPGADGSGSGKIPADIAAETAAAKKAARKRSVRAPAAEVPNEYADH